MKSIALAATLAALSGLFSTGALAQGGAEPAEPNASAATWRMPAAISPVIAAPRPASEEMFTANIPGTGLVRGTREALSGLGAPLQPAPGLNRTVEACREVVGAEAMKIGAKEIEAVSAGREQHARGGKIWGPVRMRITYARPDGYEVREATLICVVDRKGKILDAYM